MIQKGMKGDSKGDEKRLKDERAIKQFCLSKQILQRALKIQMFSKVIA